MIPYATTTRTRRNVAALRGAGWRLLLTPDIYTLHDGFRYAIDNGAWGCHQRGEQWDESGFYRLAEAMGRAADWIVLPDRVAGGVESLQVSLRHRDRVLGLCCRAMLAVQDGMTPADVAPHIGDRVGVFVGGSTEWKLSTMRQWAGLANELGAACHIARVNTVRRINRCINAGAHSFDGTSVTRFACTLPKLDAARKQISLEGLL